MKVWQVLVCASVLGFQIQANDQESLIMADPDLVQELYQIMKDVHELLTQENICYWVDSGTLMGLVLYKVIIPCDFDLVICCA